MKNSIFLSLIIILLFSSCIGIKPPEKEDVVREKCKNYLETKYHKQFSILEYKQYFHGGNWGWETDLTAVPDDNKTLIFNVKYDAKNKSVKKEEYMQAYWEKQIEDELSQILKKQYPVFSIRAKLSNNKSIYFKPADLEFYPDYNEMLQKTISPVLLLEINIVKNIEDSPEAINSIMEICNNLSQKDFTKNEFEIYFYSEDLLEKFPDNDLVTKEMGKGGYPAYKNYRIKELLFKIAKNIEFPATENILALLTDYDQDSLNKVNTKLYDLAICERNSSNTDSALSLFTKIISNTSNYRFRKYYMLESAKSVEAAYEAALILEAQGRTEEALQMYKLIITKMEFEEVPLKLSDEYNTALERVKNN